MAAATCPHTHLRISLLTARAAAQVIPKPTCLTDVHFRHMQPSEAERKWSQYLVFTVTRDPLTRALSSYAFLHAPHIINISAGWSTEPAQPSEPENHAVSEPVRSASLADEAPSSSSTTPGLSSSTGGGSSAHQAAGARKLLRHGMEAHSGKSADVKGSSNSSSSGGVVNRCFVPWPTFCRDPSVMMRLCIGRPQCCRWAAALTSSHDALMTSCAVEYTQARQTLTGHRGTQQQVTSIHGSCDGTLQADHLLQCPSISSVVYCSTHAAVVCCLAG